MNTNTRKILAGGFAVLVFASAALAQEAREPPAAACLAPAAWYTLAADKPRVAPVPELFREIARRDVVLLGEQHDDADHHRWELQTLAALYLMRPQMVIGFESFPRRTQPALDKWVAGELTVKQFLEETEWEQVWNFPPELYLPLFQFARINRIPMVALNVERTLTEAITRKGWEAVPESQKEGVSRPAAPSADYRDFLFDFFQKHPSLAARNSGTADRNDEAFRFFMESQTTWDRAMAEALARRTTTRAGDERPLVVGVMGSGHVRYGYGVPHQLRDLGVTNVGTLLPVDAGEDCRSIKPGFADAVFSLPDARHDRPPPPRLGVRLEETGGAVRLAEVVPDSLAEKTGLKPGDRIVSIAGVPVTKMSRVIAVVRLQPAGTWLPLQVQRGAETLHIVIRFPPQK